MYKVYLVEDEPNLNSLLTSYLEKEDWTVRAFADGESALEAIAEKPHLWILDIMLPGIDGYRLIREIKADRHDAPVIFISARDADIDRIVGLELGSDDYLPKPFLPRELVIRSKKLLERVYAKPDQDGTKQARFVWRAEPYSVDEESRTAAGADGLTIELTSKEFDLLLHFARNQGRVLEREAVLVSVWGDDYFGSDRVVDDLVRRLRKKMPDLRLETVYGFGYRLVK